MWLYGPPWLSRSIGRSPRLSEHILKKTTQIASEVNNRIGEFHLIFRQFEPPLSTMLRGAVVRGRRNPRYLKLAQRLKKARKARGISRCALGETTGVSDTIVAYLEEGSRIPRISTVALLANGLGVSPGWLAYGLTSPTGQAIHDTGHGLPVRVNQLRTRLSLSRSALGEAAGITTTAIQHIEQGRRVPNLETIERLATALDVSPAWLAFGEGKPPVTLAAGEAGAADGSAQGPGLDP